MAKVWLLCGKIASGKTHFAKEQRKKKKAVLLSCDDLMLTLFDSCLGKRHNEVKKKCLRFLFGQAEQLVGLGLDVMIDSGFWRRDERNWALQYFQTRNILTLLCYFDVPEKLRRARLLERNRLLLDSQRREYIIDEDMLKRFDFMFEIPSMDEIDCLVNERGEEVYVKKGI